MAKTDPDAHVAETQRVYDELDTARALWLDNRTDPLAVARHDRAQEAVHAMRDFWRLVGHVSGTRDPESWVKVTHSEAAPLSLVTQQEA